jgi:hypothetical protein
MQYRLALSLLCALVTVGAARRVCRIHDKAMTKQQVPIVFLVCRHNEDYWQQYTNARARQFPNSCDEIYVDFGKMANSPKFQKNGWKGVATNDWIYVCPKCDEQKGKWLADHPPRKPEPGEVP